MKDYMTISEFASLRNVNINSIRYYEKQKILIPAWIDPQTKYRYYLPEQLGILDAILLCIRLNIPLKELKSYIDSNGNLDKKGLLEKGKAVMQAKIDAMQTGIAITQFNLDSFSYQYSILLFYPCINLKIKYIVNKKESIPGKLKNAF